MEMCLEEGGGREFTEIEIEFLKKARGRARRK